MSSYRSHYHSPRRTVGSYSGARYTMRNPDSISSVRSLGMDPYWMKAAEEAYNRAFNAYTEGDVERDILSHRGADDLLPADDVYVDKLNRILSAPPCIGVPPQPSCVMNGLYVGTQANAENLDCLKRHKITYVLNCAGLPSSLKNSRASRYEGTGIVYEELPIDDDEGFQIKNYFSSAHTFIDRARLGGGRVLVHCTGVSRCGAIAISYLVRSGTRLLQAAKEVKRERRCVLCNNSFMKQVVQHARTHGMLDPEPGHVHAPKYGREIDKRRIWSAHLPMIV